MLTGILLTLIVLWCKRRMRWFSRSKDLTIVNTDRFNRTDDTPR